MLRGVRDADGVGIRVGDYVTYLYPKPDGEEPGRPYWVDGVDPERGLAHLGRLGWMGGRMLRLLPGSRSGDIPSAFVAREVRQASQSLSKYRGLGSEGCHKVSKAILASAMNGHGSVKVEVGRMARAIAEVYGMKGYDAKAEGEEVTVCW